MDTLGRRLIRAFGANDQDALDALDAEDAVLHTPLGRVDGRAAIMAAAAELHRGFPGLRAALHDEFASADGTRACLRQRLDWSNTGAFQGRAPTGRAGTTTETHSVRLRDAQIVQQIAGVSTFGLPQLLLVDLGLDFPRAVPDPEPEIEPTGSVTVRDGRVARLVVGDNGFVMPHQELVSWRMEFPADAPDPDPELAAASPPG